MALPSEIKQLRSYLETAAEELSTTLTQLLMLEGVNKTTTYQKLSSELSNLQNRLSTRSSTIIKNVFYEADMVAIKHIRLKELPVTTSMTPIQNDALKTLIESSQAYFQKAFSSIKSLASKALRAKKLETFLGVATVAEINKVYRKNLRESEIRNKISDIIINTFRNGMVKIVGLNNQVRRYGLDYYGTLVAYQHRQQAKTVATILRAKVNNHDLVRISLNKSTIGDFCDAYRGRIFSITGNSENFIPLSNLPGGGPPFHPWCKHEATIFLPEFYSGNNLLSWSSVDERFLISGPSDNVSRLASTWWDIKAIEPHVANLYSK